MKTVIAGLEEGLNAIAEALEGGGGGGSSIVPTPAAADEGKVLTAGDDGTASWENPEGGLPAYDSDPQTSDDLGKLLMINEAAQGTILRPTWHLPTIRTETVSLDSSDIMEDDKSGTYYFDCSSIESVYSHHTGYHLGFMPLCDPSYIDSVYGDHIYLTSAGYSAIVSAGSLKILCYSII